MAPIQEKVVSKARSFGENFSWSETQKVKPEGAQRASI